MGKVDPEPGLQLVMTVPQLSLTLTEKFTSAPLALVAVAV
jgi:hypothetical protein